MGIAVQFQNTQHIMLKIMFSSAIRNRDTHIGRLSMMQLMWPRRVHEASVAGSSSTRSPCPEELGSGNTMANKPAY